MEDEQSSTQSLKQKLKQTVCLTCCFRAKQRETPDSPSSGERPRLRRASSTGLGSCARELPDIKEKCRHLIGRIGRRHSKRSSSVDFSYDPLSYSLNFDEGFDDGYLDEAPLRNISTAKAPVSPPLKTVAVGEGEADDLVKPAVPGGEITCSLIDQP